MPRIEDNFKWGDLIYGLDKIRTLYQHRYLKNKWMDFATIDEYHRTMIPGPGLQQSMHFLVEDKNLPIVPRVLARKDAEFQRKTDPGAQSGLPPGGITHVDYWNSLTKTKHSPVAAAGLGKDQQNWPKLQKQTGKELQPGADNQATLKEMEYYLAIRRSCKYGLEYVCTATAVKVHFALDTIDLMEVVQKALRENKLSITGSELRYAFRNWDRFNGTGRVLFYIEGEQVSAPWEKKNASDLNLSAKVKGYEDERIWESYAQARAAKHATK